MTDHPITPPPELRQDWAQKARLLSGDDPVSFAELLCNKSARWGADMELEACCEWLAPETPEPYINALRAARRPKPPSLKELNLKHLEVMERDGHYLPEIISDLRRAIESMPDV